MENEIKSARRAAHLTRKALSDMYGIPYRTLENWENGYNKPSEFIKKAILKIISEYRKGKEMKKFTVIQSGFEGSDQFEAILSKGEFDRETAIRACIDDIVRSAGGKARLSECGILKSGYVATAFECVSSDDESDEEYVIVDKIRFKAADIDEAASGAGSYIQITSNGINELIKKYHDTDEEDSIENFIIKSIK